MREPVFCHECQAANQRSRVSVAGSRTTMMGSNSFYDEDGRYHHHDSNKTTTSYRCSNGHHFERLAERRCWCEAKATYEPEANEPEPEPT